MNTQQSANYKTALCHRFQQTGSCPKGDRCQFAHGQRELRPKPRSGALGVPQASAPPQGGGITAEFDNYVVDEKQVKNMVLNEMVEGLKEFYSTDRSRLQRLKTAKDMTEFGNYEMATDILNEIFYNPAAGFKEREAFQKIISTAVMNALELIELSQTGTGGGDAYNTGFDDAGMYGGF